MRHLKKNREKFVSKTKILAPKKKGKTNPSTKEQRTKLFPCS